MTTLSLLLEKQGYRREISGPIDTLELMLVDINGQIRGKILQVDPDTDLSTKTVLMPASAFVCDFCGDCITETGLIWETGDPDFPCTLDDHSLRPMPWRAGSAQVMLQMRDDQGMALAFDPRAILARLSEQLQQKGLHAVAAMEWEFTLSDSTEKPALPVMDYSQIPDTRPGLYETALVAKHQALFDDIMRAAAVQDIPAEAIVAEAAPNQYEINLKHVHDPLLAADHALMLKRLIKAVAERHGLIASFMAKPHADSPGNGLHVHTSICDRQGHNIFTPSQAEVTNAALRAAIGGIQHTLEATLALLWPNANSFKRIAKNSYAPRTKDWGINNRNVGLRIPSGDPKATRIEHRYAGADANPYWVMACVLAGIDYGLEHGCAASDPCEGMVADSPAMRLPCNPEQAIEAFANNSLIAEYFGTNLQKVYTICHDKEIQRFQSTIMPIEYDWFYRRA